MDHHHEFEEIGSLVAEAVFSGGSVSEADSVFMDVYWQYVQVLNGGFDQWILNSGKDRVLSTVDSLRAIGSSRTLSLTLEAIEFYQVERMSEAELSEHLTNMSDEQYEAGGRISNAYYEFEEDIHQLAVTYYHERTQQSSLPE